MIMTKTHHDLPREYAMPCEKFAGIASLAVYLASDEHYLVGQTISPNGGMIL